MGESPEGLAGGVAGLRSELEAAGRDPAGLHVQASLKVQRDACGRPDLEKTMAQVPALIAAGGTALHLGVTAFAKDRDEIPAVIERATQLLDSMRS